MIFFLVIKRGQSGPLFPSTLLPFSALDPFSVSAPGSYHRRYHLLFPSSCFGSHQHHHRLHLFPSSLSAPFLLFLFMIAITTITVHLCSSCLGNHHQLHLILLRSPTVVPSLSLCCLLLLHDSIITVPYSSIFAVAVEVVSVAVAWVAALFGEPLLCCCLVLPSLLLFLQQRRKLLFFCRPSVWR